MPRRVETAIWEKERELKDSLLSGVEENVPGSGSPKIPKIQIQWIVDIKKSTNMLAMLVGKPNGYGPLGHIATCQERRQELAALKVQVSRPEMVAEEKWLGECRR